MSCRYLIILLFLPLLSSASEPPKKDSLQAVIREAKTDSVKALNYLEIGDLYHYTEQDSAVHYYNKALEVAKNTGNKKIEAKCYNYIGILYYRKADYDKTLEYFNKSLKIKKKIGDKGGIANSYNNIGLIARRNGELAKALSNFRNALEIRKNMLKGFSGDEDKKRENSLMMIGKAYMNIGNVHYQLGDYPKSLKTYKNSISYFDSVDYKQGISGCYNNIGNIFEEQENYLKARDYYSTAAEIYKKEGKQKNLGTTYNNIGETYLKENQFRKARKYFDKSMNYRRKVNDKLGISAVYSNQATAFLRVGKLDSAMNKINEALKIDYEIDYKQGICEDLNFLGKLYLKKDMPRKTIEFVDRSLEMSDAMNTPLQSKKSMKLLSQAYEALDKHEKALKYYKSYKKIEDKLFNKEKHKQIEELEMKYQVEKKQQELEKQNLKLEKQQAVIKRQRTQKYAYIGGTIILLIGSIIIYWNLKQKRRANSALGQQKEEIESKNVELKQQNEEIKSQRDELQRQRDIANNQKNQIAIKNDEITSSIQYAKSIQSAVLPEEYMISKILDDYFIFFKPKDIVSGDFYFVTQKKDKIIIAAVDCTGHGVPGAFMSLLGMFLLNDIIDETKEFDAGGILNVLRTRMIQSLHQKNNSDENHDGMDISLCIWDKQTNILDYAGAYNPLYLIRDNKLTEYKGTRMSISIRSKLDESFKSQQIQLQKGDVFYLFTDGYPDQISSDNGKKMTRQRFKDLLVEINTHDLLKQKAELQDFLDNWKKDYEQVDDILVMGVRV
jgi:serine phosphatase RsbU (regulator of sigma subunit)/Tfp pilus assembly protein PilF